jgi:hypothetical protein
MAVGSCLGVSIVNYIIRCVSDNLAGYVSNCGNELSLGLVSIGVS